MSKPWTVEEEDSLRRHLSLGRMSTKWNSSGERVWVDHELDWPPESPRSVWRHSMPGRSERSVKQKAERLLRECLEKPSTWANPEGCELIDYGRF